jgi:hypothetical protein
VHVAARVIASAWLALAWLWVRLDLRVRPTVIDCGAPLPSGPSPRTNGTASGQLVRFHLSGETLVGPFLVCVSGVCGVRVCAAYARSEGTVSTRVKGRSGSDHSSYHPAATVRSGPSGGWSCHQCQTSVNRLRCTSFWRRAVSVRSRSTRACHRAVASVRHAPTAAAMPPTAAMMPPIAPIRRRASLRAARMPQRSAIGCGPACSGRAKRLSRS